jgi:hypothetical protein
MCDARCPKSNGGRSACPPLQMLTKRTCLLLTWRKRKSYIVHKETVLYFVRLLKYLLKQIVWKREGPFVDDGGKVMCRRPR